MARFTTDFSDFFSSCSWRTPLRGPVAAPGRDHHARVAVELEEAYRGTTRTLELRRPK